MSPVLLFTAVNTPLMAAELFRIDFPAPLLPLTFLVLIQLLSLFKRRIERRTMRLTLISLLMLTIPVLLVPSGISTRTIPFLLRLGAILYILFPGDGPLPGLFNSRPLKPRETEKILFWVLWFYMLYSLTLSSPAPTEAVDGLLSLHDRLLLFLLFGRTLMIFSFPRKTLTITDGELYQDGKSLSPPLSPDNRRLLLAFLEARDGRLICRDLQRQLKDDRICIEDCKASACPAYQRLYKRIRVIRDYLKLCGLGTIISPDRNSNARQTGWELRLVDEIRYDPPSSGPTAGRGFSAQPDTP